MGQPRAWGIPSGVPTEGVVLSCYELSRDRFYIDVAVETPVGLRAVSLRIPAREPIDRMWIGVDRSVALKYSVPGSLVRFTRHEHDVSPALPTHPEECLVVAGSVQFLQRGVSHERLLEIVRPFIFPSLAILFPGLRQRPSKEAYVGADAELSRSGGYVLAAGLTFDPKERRALIFADGVIFWIPVTDPTVLGLLAAGEIGQETTFREVMLRLVLLPPDPPKDGGSTRCLVALVHAML